MRRLTRAGRRIQERVAASLDVGVEAGNRLLVPGQLKVLPVEVRPDLERLGPLNSLCMWRQKCRVAI